MSELCENLRTYKNDIDVNDIQIFEISRNNRSVVFSFNNNFPLLKTTDVTIYNISFSPWSMSLFFGNKKEVKCIQQIDDLVVSIVEKHSDSLLGEYFTKQELYDERVFMPSFTDNCLNVFSLDTTDSQMSNSPCFQVYEPNTCSISPDRLVQDVVCRCAMKPWYVQVFTKTRRFRVLWIIEQCMIMEEPLNTNCVLDAEEEENEEELDIILEGDT